MSEPAVVSATLPDVLMRLRQHVREDMAPDDEGAEDVLELLDLAWLAAERWRLEQYGFRDSEGEFAGAAGA